MRKLFLALIAVLLLCGVATAATIPSVVNGADGREIWVTSVYNQSGGTMDAGDVAVWEIDASSGDDDNYVQTTTTANTHLVAGVIWPADIATYTTGLMVIRGPVAVDLLADGVNGGITTGSSLCSSGTAGSAQACTPAKAEFRFGFAVAAPSGNSVQAYINP